MESNKKSKSALKVLRLLREFSALLDNKISGKINPKAPKVVPNKKDTK
ncbi:MAG: hypothetical protein IPP56_16780 [Bacteroidetes bacterium]|nr:hypothetical protein [Bacteroidota bacterium]